MGNGFTEKSKEDFGRLISSKVNELDLMIIYKKNICIATNICIIHVSLYTREKKINLDHKISEIKTDN